MALLTHRASLAFGYHQVTVFLNDIFAIRTTQKHVEKAVKSNFLLPISGSLSDSKSPSCWSHSLLLLLQAMLRASSADVLLPSSTEPEQALCLNSNHLCDVPWGGRAARRALSVITQPKHSLSEWHLWTNIQWHLLEAVQALSCVWAIYRTAGGWYLCLWVLKALVQSSSSSTKEAVHCSQVSGSQAAHNSSTWLWNSKSGSLT